MPQSWAWRRRRRRVVGLGARRYRPDDGDAGRAEVSAALDRSGFHGSLRDYQLDGCAGSFACDALAWGATSDEMGLGKTVSDARVPRSLRASVGPHLVVAPASVVPNWVAEAESSCHISLDTFARREGRSQ